MPAQASPPTAAPSAPPFLHPRCHRVHRPPRPACTLTAASRYTHTPPHPRMPPLLQEMHDELRLQDPKVEQLNQRAAVSHDKLGGLAREARRI